MGLLENVNDKIAQSRTEMMTSLSELISVPSVVSDAKGDMPFGENVHRAFEFMLEIGEDAGFETYNAGNHGGHIDFGGNADGIVGIVGHLDVVPEGDGWDTEPYGGEIKDGYVHGRGATDDKGPVIASFYAMKALRECGYVPSRTIRLILGLDEETDWKGMDYYLAHVDSVPDMGFTPDADFPAIHGEMGIMVFEIVKKFDAFGGKGLELSSLKGGTAANSVADLARAVLHDSSGAGYDKIKDIVEDFRKERKDDIKCRKIGKSLEIVIRGISAHGATPEQGKNAVSAMMDLLGRVNFANESVNDLIGFYNDHIGYDLHGERIGCGISDSRSGRLVFNVGMMEADRKTAKITVNVRYPVTADDEQVYEGIMGVLDEYDLGIVKGKTQEPIYIPADDPLIETLMDVYRRHTGDVDSEPVVIGGGTYARAMDNTVAFGARFPGEPELAHQSNERISGDDMVKLAQIYAEAVYRLSEMER